MASATLADVASAIRGARTVTVVAHLRPDADAIGSVTASVAALRRLGLTARGQIGQDAPIEAHLLTIPGADEVTCSRELLPAELYLVLDCASLDRTGYLAGQLEEREHQVVCVDHHESNPGFGGLNLIVPEAESTTTILADLFAELGVDDTEPDIAHGLYAGLVTDTGSFRWGGARMHELGGRWLTAGLDPRRIAAELMDAVSVDDLTMIGRVLATSRMHDVDGLGVAALVADCAEVQGHPKSVLEVVIDMVTAVRGATVAAVLKELRPGHWSVSLRAPRADVSHLAVHLGGGGHRASAGYTAPGTAESVIAELLEGVRACRGEL